MLVEGVAVDGQYGLGFAQASSVNEVEQTVIEVDSFDPVEIDERGEQSKFVNIDFSTSSTTLSVVWPTSQIILAGWVGLEEAVYTWSLSAVREWKTCDDPETVTCGTTTKNGVKISELSLLDGERYYLCIMIVSVKDISRLSFDRH